MDLRGCEVLSTPKPSNNQHQNYYILSLRSYLYFSQISRVGGKHSIFSISKVAKIQHIRSCFFFRDPKWWMDWRIEFPSYSWDGIYVPTDDPPLPQQISASEILNQLAFRRRESSPPRTWHIGLQAVDGWVQYPHSRIVPYITTEKANMTMEDPPIWRCISYWTWEFSNVMLVFRGEQNLEFPIHCPTTQANISGNWTFSSQKYLANMEDWR